MGASALAGAIYLLDPEAQHAFDVTGNGEVRVHGAILINSSHGAASFLVGNARVDGPEMDIVGNYVNHGNAVFTGSRLYTGIPHFSDPLRFLPPPSREGMITRASSQLKLSQGSHTIKPGLYRGISVSGKASLFMEPGIYFIDGGGFSFTGQGSLVGEGVMIYHVPSGPSDRIQLAGKKGDVVLTPPAQGRYRGMTIFQERSADVAIDITGHGSLRLAGAVYAAAAPVKIAGNGDAIASHFVGRTLAVRGNGIIHINDGVGPWSCPP